MSSPGCLLPDQQIIDGARGVMLEEGWSSSERYAEERKPGLAVTEWMAFEVG
jgi:hypothetical protein